MLSRRGGPQGRLLRLFVRLTRPCLQVFRCPPSFRVFAAQNPVREGGGRKGLPRSFLNRFTRVAVESMGVDDLESVRLRRRLHPQTRSFRSHSSLP